MTNPSVDRIIIGVAAQNALRILIASYFLAVALQIIPGTNLTVLTSQIAPPLLAEIIAKCVVFCLSFLVMIGVWMRGAALILGLLTFFASYLTMLQLGLEEELGGFWRDLALIAALMLTYAEPENRDIRMRKAFRHSVQPRRVVLTPTNRRTRIAAEDAATPAALAPIATPPEFMMVTNIFADDPDDQALTA